MNESVPATKKNKATIQMWFALGLEIQFRRGCQPWQNFNAANFNSWWSYRPDMNRYYEFRIVPNETAE